MTSNGKVPRLKLGTKSYNFHWDTTSSQPLQVNKIPTHLPYKYCGLVIGSPSLTLEIPYLHNLHRFMSEPELKESLDWNNNVSGSSALLEMDRCAEPHRFPVGAMTLISYDYSQWLS
jgi:hypothetical protein